MFYKSKPELVQKLKRFSDSKQESDKILLMMGTSHMGEYSSSFIREKTKNYEMFNFSAPMATPSFLYYQLTKVLENEIPVSVIILEVLPETMQERANEYALKFSYDFPFFWKYREVFSKSEWEAFVRVRAFAMMRYPLHPEKISQAIQFGKTDIMMMEDMMGQAIEQYNGSLPNFNLYNTPKILFPIESKKYVQEQFSGNSSTVTQWFFLKEFIRVCKENNIRLYFFRTFLSEELEAELEKTDYRSWSLEFGEFASQNGVPFIDLNKFRKQISCQNFFDPHHLSGGCFPEITEILLGNTILKSK